MGDETDHPDQTGPDQPGPDQTQPDQNHEPETDEPDAVERLSDDLGDIDDRSDEMQQRLDELGEGIESARRQAEEDNLLPDEVGPEGGDAAFGKLGMPVGDERRETPVDDTEFGASG